MKSWLEQSANKWKSASGCWIASRSCRGTGRQASKSFGLPVYVPLIEHFSCLIPNWRGILKYFDALTQFRCNCPVQRMAATLFGKNLARGSEGDPTRLNDHGEPQQIFARNGHYVLSIALPLVERDEVNLHRSVVDELIVRIGNWKRNIALPIGLARLKVDGAKFEGDRLNILFRKEESDAGGNAEDAIESLQRSPWSQLKARLQGQNP